MFRALPICQPASTDAVKANTATASTVSRIESAMR
jgi:hypothetical protein